MADPWLVLIDDGSILPKELLERIEKDPASVAATASSTPGFIADKPGLRPLWLGPGFQAAGHAGAIDKAVADDKLLGGDILTRLMGAAATRQALIHDLNDVEAPPKQRCRLHVFTSVTSRAHRSCLRRVLALRDLGEHNELDVLIHAIVGSDGLDEREDWRAVSALERLCEGRLKMATITGARHLHIDPSAPEDERYRLVARTFDTIVRGKGDCPTSAETAIAETYHRDLADGDVPSAPLNEYDGIHGTFQAQFSSERKPGDKPSWEWRSDEVALVLDPDPWPLAPFVSLLMRHDVPEDAHALVTEHGRAVRVFDDEVVAVAPGFPSVSRVRFAEAAPADLLEERLDKHQLTLARTTFDAAPNHQDPVSLLIAHAVDKPTPTAEAWLGEIINARPVLAIRAADREQLIVGANPAMRELVGTPTSEQALVESLVEALEKAHPRA